MMYTFYALIGLLAVLLALGLDGRFREDSYGRAAVLSDPSGTLIRPVLIENVLTIGDSKAMLDISPLGGTASGVVQYRDDTQTYWLTTDSRQKVDVLRDGAFLSAGEVELHDGDALFFGPEAQLQFQYQ